MYKKINRIIFLLLLLLAMPVVFFFIQETTKLSENENMIRRVFNKQLETILFSLNQYNETLLKTWVFRLDNHFDVTSAYTDSSVVDLMDINSSIRSVCYMNIDSRKVLSTYGENVPETTLQKAFSEIGVNKLLEFREANYQKIISITLNDEIFLSFLLLNIKESTLCIIKLNSRDFIEQNMMPEVQKVSQDMFQITIAHENENVLAKNNDGSMTQEESETSQPIWYLPGYYYTIRLLSKSVHVIAAERSQKDARLLFLMFVTIAVGAFFTIRSMRNELRIAEMKSEFVSNVSHELRTPLALISMYAETLVLKRLKSKEKEEEYLQVIHTETTRLSELVNRILSFSKLERGKRQYHFEVLAINDLLQEISDLYSPHCQQNNLRISISLPESDYTIHADKSAVTEAIFNIFDNAVKYNNNEEKHIEIRVKHRDSKVIIEVEDDGIGISPKEKKRIFEKFYRVTEGDLAHKAKGSGLGLSIVQQIMKQHKGKVAVQSRVGHGSTFSLIFPVHKTSKNA